MRLDDDNVNLRKSCFVLDSYAPLSPFGFRRDIYERALYGEGAEENPLKTQLVDVSQQFQPDLVVITSQNAFALAAFRNVSIIHVEQAPLPRLSHPQRVSLDPSGHQVRSLLEQKHKILAADLAPSFADAIGAIITTLKRKMTSADTYNAGRREISKLRADAKVALFVTQPPDWVTYEGAFEAIDMPNLLCTWEAALPHGWIGVPTYHPGYRLNAEEEAALARCLPRLKFLPNTVPQGISEALLTEADGMVSISSTTTISALLYGKPAIATGHCPFNAWCPRNVADLSAEPVLTSSDAAKLFAFLSHKYVHLCEDLENDPDRFLGLARSITGADDFINSYFDFAKWEEGKARRLFSLETPN